MARTLNPRWPNCALLWLQLVTMATGFGGLALVVYGFLEKLKDLKYLDIELRGVEQVVAIITTLLGTVLVSISVYFRESEAAPAEDLSKQVVVPIALVGTCLTAALAIHWKGLPDALVNGYGVIGLAGAAFRLRPIRNAERSAHLRPIAHELALIEVSAHVGREHLETAMQSIRAGFVIGITEDERAIRIAAIELLEDAMRSHEPPAMGMFLHRRGLR